MDFIEEGKPSKWACLTGLSFLWIKCMVFWKEDGLSNQTHLSSNTHPALKVNPSLPVSISSFRKQVNVKINEQPWHHQQQGLAYVHALNNSSAL